MHFCVDRISDFVGQRERGDDTGGPVQQEDADEGAEEEQNPDRRARPTISVCVCVYIYIYAYMRMCVCE